MAKKLLCEEEEQTRGQASFASLASSFRCRLQMTAINLSPSSLFPPLASFCSAGNVQSLPNGGGFSGNFSLPPNRRRRLVTSFPSNPMAFPPLGMNGFF
jgi:hypothetical protein